MKNFFTEVAKNLAKSNITDAFVFAGDVFHGLGPDSLAEALDSIQIIEQSGLPTSARWTIGKHYEQLPREFCKNPGFMPGASGHILVNDVVVSFTAKLMNDVTYVVRFEKVDAHKLIISIEDRLAKLERMVC